MAGIILNGSVIKGLILNGSPVTAMLNGVKVFPTGEPGPSPSTELLFQNLTTYTTPGLMFSSGALSTSKEFIVFKFKLSTGTTNADSYVYMRSSTDTSKIIWLGNARNYGGYSYASIFRSSASGWNAFMNPGLGTDGAVTGNVYYAPDVSADSDCTFKIIFMTSISRAFVNINGLDIMSADYIPFNPLNFEVGQDGSNVTFSNFQVFGCDTFADALAT